MKSPGRVAYETFYATLVSYGIPSRIDWDALPVEQQNAWIEVGEAVLAADQPAATEIGGRPSAAELQPFETLDHFREASELLHSHAHIRTPDDAQRWAGDLREWRLKDQRLRNPISESAAQGTHKP